jgi:hypothetical protein
LVVLVAVAIVLLPASGAAAFAASLDGTHGHAAIALTADADDAAPCDHDTSAVNDCGSMSACALKCFAYTGLPLPSLGTVFSTAGALPVLAPDLVTSRDSAPPFRPPRA